MEHTLDCIALFYIRRRLAGFRKRGDFADRFGDRMVALRETSIK